MPRKFNCDDYCNTFANQYLVLVAIFASILSNEIDNDEDLGILGTFLIALGEELALASEIRIACKAKFEEGLEGEESEFISSEVLDAFERSYIKKKKVKKKYKK